MNRGLLERGGALLVTHHQRGDLCVFGHDEQLDVDPMYLETHENTMRFTATRFPGTFNGTAGRMRHLRTPQRLTCNVLDRAGAVRTASDEVAVPVGTTGNIVVRADRLRVRLEYVWIVYEPSAR